MKNIFIKTIGLATLLGTISYLKYREDYPIIESHSSVKYHESVKQINIIANDRKIYGELLRPSTIQGKLPLVICAHGFDSSTTFMKRLCGLSLVRSGLAVLVFDFCGGALKTKSDWTMDKMNINTELEDLNAVIDYASNLEDVDTNNIYLVGESLGSLVAALCASKRKEDIAGLILYYPAFSLSDTAKKKYPDINLIPNNTELFGIKLSKEFFTSIYDRDFINECSTYDKPVLILHGDKDEIVDVTYARKASEAYQNVKYIEYNDEIHNFKAKGKALASKEVYNFIIDNKKI